MVKHISIVEEGDLVRLIKESKEIAALQVGNLVLFRAAMKDEYNHRILGVFAGIHYTRPHTRYQSTRNDIKRAMLSFNPALRLRPPFEYAGVIFPNVTLPKALPKSRTVRGSLNSKAMQPLREDYFYNTSAGFIQGLIVGQEQIMKYITQEGGWLTHYQDFISRMAPPYDLVLGK